ncbi:hypothetical protein ACFXI8_26610 [Streptomyces niveus]|uniref:hypothetical protein n=1 Tax=Streptomyces niveus TaxID=193462 RepID=UPI0036ABC247
MTTLHVEDNTHVGRQADLLDRLTQLLNSHPAGGAFKLLLAPATLEIADDEVLVQQIDTDRRVVELRPRKLSDVTLTDVLHATQLTDPADEAYRGYTATPRSSNCVKSTRPDGSTGHLYFSVVE